MTYSPENALPGYFFMNVFNIDHSPDYLQQERNL